MADSLYWMSRYLERLEHTARLLDVNLQIMLEQDLTEGARRWTRLLRSLRVRGVPTDDPYALANRMTFDDSQAGSILACVESARDNARQVREQISSEMWEDLNRLYLWLRSEEARETWYHETHTFYERVTDGVHLFQGVTDSTLSHGEGWHFLQVGRYLERANSIAWLVDAYFSDIYDPLNFVRDARNYLEWVSLLRSCTAFEAYCKVQRADLDPVRIADFVLLNPDFPHSLNFSVTAMESALDSISVFAHTRKNTKPSRLAGRLRSTLNYGQIDEIMGNDLQVFLVDVQSLCGQVHAAIQQVYISYAIESAISPA